MKTLIARCLVFIAASASLTTGCKFDFGAEEPEEQNTETGDPGAFVDLTLASTRPTTGSLQSGTALNVPENAVAGDVEIRLERPAESRIEDLLARYTGDAAPLTAPHQLTPYSLELAEDAILTLPLTTSTNSSLALVMWLDSETDPTWESGSVASIEGDRGYATLDRFGILMLVEADPNTLGADAGFELPGDLSQDELEDLQDQYEGSE